MQNITHAVMSQRHEGANSLDPFWTPPWAVRALCEHVLIPGVFACDRSQLARYDVWEPACGPGHMARALAEYFDEVYASDVFDYGWPGMNAFIDFTDSPVFELSDFIITNPPFKLASKFVIAALSRARIGVCMLVRGPFTETVGRYNHIFKETPPTIVAYFSERVPMHRNRLLKKGKSATQYIWLVWIKDWAPMPPLWIPPCRKQLEMESDYLDSPDR